MRLQHEASDRLHSEIRKMIDMAGELEEVIKCRERLDERAKHELGTMLREFLSESRAIMNAFARSANGEIRIEWSDVHLLPLLQKIIGTLQSHSFQVLVDCEVPKELHISAIPDLLESILEIILENSLKATGRKSRTKVSAHFAPDAFGPNEPGYEIAVLNPGHIPENTLNAILRRRPIPREDGYGIGLLIANSQLDLLGGHLKISNTEEGVLTRIILKKARWL